MSNIAQIQSSDTFDFQRRRINDAIDIVNSMGGGIAELESEANLPDPTTATSNIYLIRNHSKFKGAALAALINGVYKISPLKNDVMNSNQFIYVDNAKLASSVTMNKCVYLDSTGVWQLANSSDSNKYAQGIVGPYNSIILGGILYSPSLNLSVGATYYYDNNGNLTLTPTIGKVGVAIDTNVLSLHFLSINTEVQDIETAVNYNHITNCITHIPQDIKLEVNSENKVVLKAGSKLYRPNGVGVFDDYIVDNDKTVSSTGTFIAMLLVRKDGTIWASGIDAVTSGTTPPTGTGTFYNTDTNTIDYYSNGTYNERAYTLPFAIVQFTDGVPTIKQVFNGFGYIGSCVFTLPGVKGLYPDGRNADGTLKNGIVNCTSVQVSSNYDDTSQHCLFLQANGRCHWYTRDGFYYVKETNTIHHSQNHTKLNALDAGIFDVTAGVISNFKPNQVFRAVDYDDFKNATRVVSKTNDGLVPQLPNETTVKKFLRQDGVWAEPPESLLKSGGAMTGTLSDVSAAQVRNIVILSEEQDTGVDGTIYMVIEEY